MINLYCSLFRLIILSLMIVNLLAVQAQTQQEPQPPIAVKVTPQNSSQAQPNQQSKMSEIAVTEISLMRDFDSLLAKEPVKIQVALREAKDMFEAMASNKAHSHYDKEKGLTLMAEHRSKAAIPLLLWANRLLSYDHTFEDIRPLLTILTGERIKTDFKNLVAQWWEPNKKQIVVRDFAKMTPVQLQTVVNVLIGFTNRYFRAGSGNPEIYLINILDLLQK